MGTQISIDKVWPPKKTNGKYGTVKLTDGNRRLIPIAILNQVRSGMMAVVETHEENWSDGTVTIIDKVMENPQSNGASNGAVASYDPGAKDRQIFIQGVAQAALHGISWTSDSSVRDAVFSAVEAAQDAYNTFILGHAPKPIEAKQASAPTNYRESGKPYSTAPADDPRFAAPPPTEDAYGARR